MFRVKFEGGELIQSCRAQLWRLPYLVVFVMLLVPAYGLCQERYVVGFGSVYNNDIRIPEVESIIRSMYERIGIEVEFRYAPAKRDIESLNNGSIDASFLRNIDEMVQYENAIAVPIDVLNVKYVFAIKVIGLVSAPIKVFRSKKIAIINGDLTALRILGHSSGEIIKTVNLHSALMMLNAGRVDAVLAVSAMIDVGVKDYGFEFMRSELKIPVQLFHIVHVRHRGLVEPLSQAILEMRRDGSLKALAGKYADMVPDDVVGN